LKRAASIVLTTIETNGDRWGWVHKRERITNRNSGNRKSQSHTRRTGFFQERREEILRVLHLICHPLGNKRYRTITAY
jgi:hypothetical protein